MKAVFSSEREVENKLRLIKYSGGNGEFHSHSQIEICIVDKGKINAYVGDKTKLLQKDEVALSLGYDTHAYLPVGEADFSVLIIPSEISENFLSHIKHRIISSPFICNPEIGQTIREFVTKIEGANHLEKLGLTYLLLSHIAETLFVSKPEQSDTDELLSKLVCFVHGNFKNNLSLEQIAEEFGYNPSYISRYFKKNFGIGIMRFLNIIRLKYALELMRKNELDMTCCALESGFNSVRTFYRVFGSEFGCSPKEYLKKFN